MPEPGIVQIAAALGISPSTVSRALRPETADLVRPEKRKQILEFAERQRFAPNQGARMLRSGAVAALTVVVPLDQSIFLSEFYGRFLAGVLQAADNRGWTVLIRTLRRNGGADLVDAIRMISLDTSGMIYLAEPLSVGSLKLLQGFARPLVLTKGTLPAETVEDLGLPVVGADNYGGARTAAALLLQLGHRRIALFMGPAHSRDGIERKRGYLDALADAGLDVPPAWISEGPFSAESGQDRMRGLLESDELPTAICCASDEIAYGAIASLQAAGKRCPADVSVIGFDDGFWASMCRPPLTTIRQPLAEIAELAVAAIVEAAQSPAKGLPPVARSMPTSLVIRESTGIVRDDHTSRRA